MKKTNYQIVKRTSLQQLMSQLMAENHPAAQHNQSCMANEIGTEIQFDASNQKLVDLITELLETVVSNSRNGEIFITADRYSDVVILSIQERNNYNGYALAYSVKCMEEAATKMGGHISIKGPQQRVATVSFTFPAQAA